MGTSARRGFRPANREAKSTSGRRWDDVHQRLSPLALHCGSISEPETNCPSCRYSGRARDPTFWPRPPSPRSYTKDQMPFSHHSHSGEFCGHGENRLEEVLLQAIARKMDVFAMTEHMPRREQDLYPEEVCEIHNRSDFCPSTRRHFLSVC